MAESSLEYQQEISKIIAFRKEYLVALNVKDVQRGLGFGDENYININVKGLGGIPIKPLIRGDFSRISRAKKVEIVERKCPYQLAALEM